MKYAADFRRIARNALSGRWGLAVVAGLVASLLGAVTSETSGVNLNFGSTGSNEGVTGQPIVDSTVWNEEIAGILVGVVSVVLVLVLIVAVAYAFLGSIVGVGYSQFNLDLVDRKKAPEIGTLFGHFRNWKTAVAAGFLRGLYVILWSLLFVIPGIVAGYSYAMTNYILAEHPELTASEAIDKSKQMMYGNRGRLFCLQLSFIGWNLLCILTLGIGNLWLIPYKQAAEAAFYREVSGTEYIVTPTATPEVEPGEQ